MWQCRAVHQCWLPPLAHYFLPRLASYHTFLRESVGYATNPRYSSDRFLELKPALKVTARIETFLRGQWRKMFSFVQASKWSFHVIAVYVRHCSIYGAVFLSRTVGFLSYWAWNKNMLSKWCILRELESAISACVQPIESDLLHTFGSKCAKKIRLCINSLQFFPTINTHLSKGL